jgi:hypothetical protein
MDNHYHVVIETPEGNLSKRMGQLNGVYTPYYNRQHNRVGHVFFRGDINRSSSTKKVIYSNFADMSF